MTDTPDTPARGELIAEIERAWMAWADDEERRDEGLPGWADGGTLEEMSRRFCERIADAILPPGLVVIDAGAVVRLRGNLWSCYQVLLALAESDEPCRDVCEADAFAMTVENARQALEATGGMDEFPHQNERDRLRAFVSARDDLGEGE